MKRIRMLKLAAAPHGSYDIGTVHEVEDTVADMYVEAGAAVHEPLPDGGVDEKAEAAAPAAVERLRERVGTIERQLADADSTVAKLKALNVEICNNASELRDENETLLARVAELEQLGAATVAAIEENTALKAQVAELEALINAESPAKAEGASAGDGDTPSAPDTAKGRKK